MFQLERQEAGERLFEQLSNVYRRTQELLESNQFELSERMQAMRPPLETVEELYDAAHFEYEQRREQVYELTSMLRESSSLLEKQISLKAQLRTRRLQQFATHEQAIQESQLKLQRLEDELGQAHELAAQRQQELRNSSEVAAIMQQNYRQALHQSSIKELNSEDKTVESTTRIDGWEQQRQAMRAEIQQLKKMLALKDEFIAQHQIGRLSQCQDIKEQQARIERIRNQSLTLEENIKAILHDNRAMQEQLEHLSDRMQLVPRRLHSLPEQPRELLSIPFVNKVSIDEKSQTLRKCMSILSNRSRSELADITSAKDQLFLPKKSSILLQLPTFDTDNSYVLHTSVLTASERLDTSCADATFQPASEQQPKPLEKKYCNCHTTQPGILAQLFQTIGSTFQAISERLVRKRIRYYSQLNRVGSL